MPGWQQGAQETETPGPTDPLNPQDPGWRRWLEPQAERVEELTGRKPDGVALQEMSAKGPFWFPIKGDEPADWKADPVTATTRPPAEHLDWTRFSRRYTNVRVQRFFLTTIKVIFIFNAPNPTTWEKEFEFWEWTDETLDYEEYFVYRWMLTSLSDEQDGLGLDLFDATGPWNETWAPKWGIDSDKATDRPPQEMLDGVRRNTVDGPYFVAATDGWGPASADSIFLARKSGVKLGAAKAGARRTGARKRRG
jgi:hypothetical protein